jgi:hypothetical protein
MPEEVENVNTKSIKFGMPKIIVIFIGIRLGSSVGRAVD